MSANADHCCPDWDYMLIYKDSPEMDACCCSPLEENPMTKFVCIYHENCADGFGAAWVVREAFRKNIITYNMTERANISLDFYPGVYQTPVSLEKLKHAVVIIVDFSYKRPVMAEISKVAKRMVWIDHHKSALEDMKGFSQSEECECEFIDHTTTERSGAWLTWEYFFDKTEWPMPKLIEHIDDRDRWQFDLPRTREIQANLFSYPYDFDIWDKLMMMDEDMLYGFALQGEAIERKHFKDIAEMLKVTQRTMLIDDVVVPCASLPYIYSSDAGHMMAKENPEPTFAACYWDTPEGRIFSLRSRDDGMDVSKVAVKFGGGGHAHAAGFKVPWGPNVTHHAVYPKE